MMRPLTSIFTRPSAVPRQASFEEFRILDGFDRRNSSQAADKSLEIGRLGQLAIQTRRADLQNVAGPGNEVLDVEKHAQLFADGLAIAMTDSFRFIDVNAQKSLLADFPFDIDYFDPGRAGGAFGGVAYALQLHGLPAVAEHFLQQKSGLAPTRMCDRLRTKVQYSGRELQKQGTGGSLRFTLKSTIRGINQANTEASHRATEPQLANAEK